MTAESYVAASRPSLLPVQVTYFSLVALLALAPPESQGPSMAGCALLAVLLAALGLHAAPLRGRLLIALAVLLAVPLVRIALAPGAALEPLAVAILAAGVGLAAAGLPGGETVRRRAALGLAVTAGAVSVHALYQKLWGLDRVLSRVAGDPSLPDHGALVARLEGGRAFAGFITPAGLGGFLALAMPVTLALAVGERGRARLACFALATVEAAAFVAAASATAGAALVGATALAASLWSRSRRAVLVAGCLVLAMLAAVALQRGGIALRPEDPGGPWRLRAGNFRSAWAMAADHPWLGVGPGGFGELYPRYRQAGDNETRHVHDLPLELAAELGWPGALLVAGLFFGLFLGPLAAERDGPLWRRGVAVGLAAFALHNLGDFTAFMPSILWLAALFRGSLARGEPSQEPSVAGRLATGMALVGLAVAAGVAGLSGLADEARLDARYAAHAGDVNRAFERAIRATTLAPWSPDAALLAARAAERIRGAADPTVARLAERVVRLSPVRPAAREFRAGVRLSRDDLEGAWVDLVQAARGFPTHAGYARERDRVRARLDAVWDSP